MKIQYCCTYWGSEKDPPALFLDKVLSAGYDGSEIYLPPDNQSFNQDCRKALDQVMDKHPGFLYIAQQLTAPENETVDAYISRMKKSLLELASLQPAFINSHTGKDHYSFDDNCRVIEAALNISSQTGVRILHETHRGRFSYHAASLIPYLIKFPELELVGDFSHFCTVSESMLQDQEDIIRQIIPHVSHIHARVGHEQGPQVNDPFAPEWQNHLAVFETWWQQILEHKKQCNHSSFSITPEFGPAPYMPSMPYTQQPLGNQWNINCNMMHRLKASLKT